MQFLYVITAALCAAIPTRAFDQVLGFDDAPAVEHRSINEIYHAALAEGGVVTLWHGGDAPNQQDPLKAAFEKRFPGMKLNLTVDFSKYQDGNLDRQLAVNDVYVDTIIAQSLHDYPRWKDEDALLKYQPLGFDKVHPRYRDANSAYYGVQVISWSFVWNTKKSESVIKGFDDFLKPEYKNKLALTYPNDDDAVLFQFDLIMQKYGLSWFEKLLEQNPRWVRGIETPVTLMAWDNSSAVATFTSTVGLTPPTPFNISFPTRGQVMSWPLTAGILKKAPHPEGAKLLSAFLLSDGFQKNANTFSALSNFRVANQPYDASDAPNTDPMAFVKWTADRARVERLRNWFEDKIGTAQGLSPLKGGLY